MKLSLPISSSSSSSYDFYVVKRLVDESKLPHLLLYGPPGTGKTSMILAIAKQMYGDRAGQMTLHLNASDARGIDVVRNDIQGFASTRHIFNKGFKLIILDECDAMTNDAQFALRRIIEKYTKNVRFCLICNYVNKVIPALQSRCTRFRFSPLADTYMRQRLQHIIQQEGLQVEEEGEQQEGGCSRGLEAVVRLSRGDMRRALNLLQSLSMSSSTGGAALSEAAVYSCTGQTHPREVREMVRLLLNEPLRECMRRIGEMQRQSGFALVDILSDVYQWVVRLSLPNQVTADLLDALAEVEYNLAGSASEQLQLGGMVGAFMKARKDIVNTATTTAMVT